MRKISSILIVVTIFGFLAFMAFPIKSQSEEMPKEIVVTALPMPSGGYTAALSQGQAIKDETGVQVNVLTGGSELARFLPIKAGEAQFACVVAGSAYFFSHGIGDYAKEEWGPQAIRGVWIGSVGGQSFVTKGNSGIKEMKDLKGKRIAWFPANVFYEFAIKGGLAFGGLSLDDVVLVPVTSSTAAWRALIEGSIDAFGLMMTTAPKGYELEASRDGIYWIPLPHKDKDAWNRMLKYLPVLVPYTCSTGAGVKKDNPIEIATNNYGIFGYATLKDEYAYVWTKGAWNGRKMWAEKHPFLKLWTYDVATDYKLLQFPYHDGTVKFFKEIGVWTEKHEKWQSWQVALEKKRKEYWKEAIKIAREKKIQIGSEDFSKFWMQQLEEQNLIGIYKE